MKKLLSCVLTLVLLCALLAVPAQAAGSGSLSVSSASGYRGDTVTVDVYMNSNPGLITMKFQVFYSANLTLVSVSNSGLLGGWTTPAPTISSPYTLRWADSLSTTNSTATGKLATLTFKINDNAKIGTETVSIIFNESRDAEGAKNSFSGASANITGIGILRKEGHEVSNGDFFKIGIPFTLSAIVPAYILIWILFGV